MKRSSFHPQNSNHKHQKCNAYRNKRWQVEVKPFRCSHCKQMIFPNDVMGTYHRNHCPHCLWSLHVDTKPGNRSSTCHGSMEPVGLTFKHNGFDKYGRERCGDVMIVHICKSCAAININRIAADDCTDQILAVFDNQSNMSAFTRARIAQQGIELLKDSQREALNIALFGKSVHGDIFNRQPLQQAMQPVPAWGRCKSKRRNP